MIKINLLWKAFKIVIVSRRTSLVFLDPVYVHTPVKNYKNSADFTGHFLLPEIWKKKKKYIWINILKNQFSNKENEKIIRLIDTLMLDGDKNIGIDYQSIIAPLMSYGIRRNARAQAHAASELYKLLCGNNDTTINLNDFYDILNNDFHMFAEKFMFRRALIEIQFKWSMSEGNKERWKQLNIGHLSGEKEKIWHGKKY